MTKFYYSEETFAIDLISEAYATSNPLKIIDLANEVLSIKLSEAEVKDYLNYTEDFEKESRFVSMANHFKEQEHEQ